MTESQAIIKLIACQHMDQETGHIEADQVLCDLLISLGYENVVKEFYEINKWYA